MNQINMDTPEKLTFPHMLREAVKAHGGAPALSYVGEEPMTYNDVLARTESVAAFLESMGVGPGDRVAILSTNMPNWGITYLAISFIRAVVVPLLPLPAMTVEASSVPSTSLSLPRTSTTAGVSSLVDATSWRATGASFTSLTVTITVAASLKWPS